MASPDSNTDSKSKVLARAKRRASFQIAAGAPDRSDLVELAKTIYPSSEVTDPQYYRWQYDANPSGSAVSRVAINGAQTIGHYGVIPLRYSLNGQLVKGSLSLNTMTHADHRGKGIFMLLAEDVFSECRAQGNVFTLGFPNPNSIKGFTDHLDFKVIGEIPLWLLPIDLSHSGRVPGMLAPLIRLATAGWRAVRKPKTEGIDVKEIRDGGAAFDSFWSSVQSDYENILVRDAAFVNWRFLKHPTRKYRVFVAQENGKITGFVAIRTSKIGEMDCGYIVDLLVSRSSKGLETAKALVSRATVELSKTSIAVIGCLMPESTTMAKALRINGFLKCPARFLPQPFPVIVREHLPQASLGESLFDFKKWFLTMGDYDVG